MFANNLAIKKEMMAWQINKIIPLLLMIILYPNLNLKTVGVVEKEILFLIVNQMPFKKRQILIMMRIQYWNAKVSELEHQMISLMEL